MFVFVGGHGSSYDANHRNPLYCNADSDCSWELLSFAHHYHPSVALFANALLKASTLISIELYIIMQPF